MFINNINPDIISIGPFVIRFYGIVYALALLTIAHMLGKAGIKNLDKDKAYDLAIYGMIGGLIGARLFHVIADFYLYKNNLIGIFYIWNGGLGFQGGLLGAIITVYYFCNKNKINLLRVLDSVAIPSAFFLGLGRIANYINSEHLGFITDVPWCVVFERVDSICRHPAQIYQAISQFVLFGILFFVSKRKHKKGTLTWTFFAGYGVFRFITDSFRSDLNAVFLGMSHTQMISLLMAGIGFYNLYNLYIKKR